MNDMLIYKYANNNTMHLKTEPLMYSCNEFNQFRTEPRFWKTEAIQIPNRTAFFLKPNRIPNRTCKSHSSHPYSLVSAFLFINVSCKVQPSRIKVNEAVHTKMIELRAETIVVLLTDLFLLSVEIECQLFTQLNSISIVG